MTITINDYKKDIFIIVVTFNSLHCIDECLQSTGNYRVIVVDNASSDQTVDHIKANYPNVILLPQQKNLGFGQGNNVGISYALKKGANQVFLLNQDAYLVDDCMDILIKKQQENSQYGILSPVHLNGKGNKLDKNFGDYISYQNAPELLSDLLLNKQKEIYEIPFVNAAGWLISKKCLETVGGFDPIFFHYGEDDNYCQRLQFHGFKIGIVLNTFLLHDREDRQFNQLIKYSNEYYNYLERHYKLKYGDINQELKIDDEITLLKSILVKKYLMLKFKDASYIRKQLKLINKIKDIIANCREVNRYKGKHYL